MNPLRKIMSWIAGDTPPRFVDDDGARALEAMLRAADEVVGAPPARDEDFDTLQRQVFKAIRGGRLRMDFAPSADGLVTLPPAGDPLYFQALAYWSARLREPLRRVAEACRRAGDGATQSVVKRTVAKIRHEDRVSSTDRFFLDSTARSGD